MEPYSITWVGQELSLLHAHILGSPVLGLQAQTTILSTVFLYSLSESLSLCYCEFCFMCVHEYLHVCVWGNAHWVHFHADKYVHVCTYGDQYSKLGITLSFSLLRFY